MIQIETFYWNLIKEKDSFKDFWINLLGRTAATSLNFTLHMRDVWKRIKFFSSGIQYYPRPWIQVQPRFQSEVKSSRRKAVCINMESNCVKLTPKYISTEAVVWQRLCCRTYLEEAIHVLSPFLPQILSNLTSRHKILVVTKEAWFETFAVLGEARHETIIKLRKQWLFTCVLLLRKKQFALICENMTSNNDKICFGPRASV